MNEPTNAFTGASGSCPHILVFPFPAQGHMLPLLDLTHRLALQNLTITVLVTPKNLHILAPLLATHPSVQPLILPFPATASIPANIENTQQLPSTSFGAVIIALGNLRTPLLHWFQSHPSPPTTILSDMFLGWTHHLASQLGIPRIVFCPSGSLTLSLYAVLWRDLPDRVDSNNSNEMVSFGEIPNCPSYPWWQISPLFRSYVKGDPESEFLREGKLANFKSFGIVFNSFYELEEPYLDYIKKVMGHSRVWAVGPLVAYQGLSNETGSIPCNILTWLDACEDDSVVYVCFGSQIVMTNNQMEELALGLEKSGTRFIWITKNPTVKHGSVDYGKLPDGFENRVAGRGVVIKEWAPQALILKHPAVGAFLTHCGWNSVLESLVAGVPMLAWPMGADQFANATLLVDQLGVAIRVCEGEKTIPNSSELAQAIARSVTGNGFHKARVRSMELSKAGASAVKQGGGSFKDLQEMTDELSGLKFDYNI